MTAIDFSDSNNVYSFIIENSCISCECSCVHYVARVGSQLKPGLLFFTDHMDIDTGSIYCMSSTSSSKWFTLVAPPYIMGGIHGLWIIRKRKFISRKLADD